MKRLFNKLLLFFVFFLLSFFVTHGEVNAACTEPGVSGDYHVSASCAFAGTDNGIDQGDLYIDANQTLTINASQYVLWNPGKKVVINGIIANSGGSLLQDELWAVDADADGCTPSATWYRTANKPANTVRINTLLSRSTLDTNDANGAVCDYAYSQSAYWRYAYGQSAYWRYSYGQSTYWRYSYSQSSYYRQSTYYRQSGYYDGCFPAGTPVLMSDGSYKEIQDIIKGDKVASYNVSTGQRSESPVGSLVTHETIPGDDKLLLINRSLQVTSNHNIYSPNRGAWVRADELKSGDTILNSSGNYMEISSIDDLGQPDIPVFNLNLQGQDHNYFAGDTLVHNIWKN